MIIGDAVLRVDGGRAYLSSIFR